MQKFSIVDVKLSSKYVSAWIFRSISRAHIEFLDWKVTFLQNQGTNKYLFSESEKKYFRKEINRLLFLYLGFFQEHSRYTGQQRMAEVISLFSVCHFHPLHKQLYIRHAITVESLFLLIASSRGRTRHYCLPSIRR